MSDKPVMSRVWAMPNCDTFSIPPIAGFVQKYLLRSKVSVDPFARNKRWATYTNDLNPDTAAQSHQTAADFLSGLASNGTRADLIIFDPPYSLGQCKEVYASIGKDFLLNDAQQVGRWISERDSIMSILEPGGVVLTFGWNSIGMGVGRGFQIEEILLIAHGSAHNDTICIAERRLPSTPDLFQ